MKAETFILKWKERGKWHEKEIDRNNFIVMMNGIKAGFDDNNEVSTYLGEIAKTVTAISIDKERNDTRNVPFIIYDTDDKESIMYEILRTHKIIWSILNGLCYIISDF